MNALRILLRLVTIVLAISIVVLVLLGGFWYIWQDARGRAPDEGYTITAGKVEQVALGLYLRYKESKISDPIAPDDDRNVTFEVQSGESVGDVGYRLERAGLIQDADVFRRVVQYWGAENGLQVGVYSLRPNMTMVDIMRELQYGRTASARVTIPEGWRAEEIAALLEQQGIAPAADFLAAVQQTRTGYSFLESVPAESTTGAEGFVFPDTYDLPLDATVDQVLGVFLANWDARVPQDLRDKAAAQDLTLYEVLTVASIVEREAQVAEERALIAGVYLNRIKEGMTLDADPTVQYAKGYDQASGRWWPQLTGEDTKGLQSPYNTYINPGLPPGPICNPGLASIQATLEPADTNYLYFFHKGDGTHVFAETYEEHLRNVETYSAGQ